MYGSLINRLQERMVIGAPTPEVGMGVTMTSYSDRSAGTIVEVKKMGKGLLITVCEDDAKRIDNNGMSESQEYEYTFNPKGATYMFRQAKPDTCWVKVYRNANTNRLKQQRGGFYIGKREKYHDFSF